VIRVLAHCRDQKLYYASSTAFEVHGGQHLLLLFAHKEMANWMFDQQKSQIPASLQASSTVPSDEHTQQLQEVKQWLGVVFASSNVPAVPQSREAVGVLHRLRDRVAMTRVQTDALIEDCRQKASEYSSERMSTYVNISTALDERCIVH